MFFASIADAYYSLTAMNVTRHTPVAMEQALLIKTPEFDGFKQNIFAKVRQSSFMYASVRLTRLFCMSEPCRQVWIQVPRDGLGWHG